MHDIANNSGPEDISTHIEGKFLQEIENAEELAKVIEHGMASYNL